jgi:hypothetical protein
MVSLLLVASGLAALAAPLLLAFAAVAAWAVIRPRTPRRVALGALAAVGTLIPVTLGYQMVAESRNQRAFENHCQRDTTPQILAAVTRADRVLVDYTRDDRNDRTVIYGSSAFPWSVAAQLLLTGVQPLSELTIRRGPSFEVAHIDGDGLIRTDDRRELPDATIAYSWEPNEFPSTDVIGSVVLVVKDLQAQLVLARQPVFVTWTPPLKAFPSLWAAPVPVRQESVRSCPTAFEIAKFLRTVVAPGARSGPQ